MSESEFNEIRAKTMALDQNKSIYYTYYNPHTGYRGPQEFAMALDPKKSKEGKLKLASNALHPEFITLLAEVAEMSVEKGYTPLNWLEKDSPVSVTYCLNAAERHRQQAKLGIDRNTEEKTLDGDPTKLQPMHLAQSAYNDLMAALLILKRPEADDRVFRDGELK